MIRRGREEGWLKQPIASLPTWANFHGVKFNDVKVGPLPGFEERGSTVIANARLQAPTAEPLLIVPKDLIISRANIELFARSDRHLREVLDAVGDFAKTTRGAVLVFLLMQATINCPDIRDIGVLNPLTEYIKYLPDELLPTFWTEEEQDSLEGTTLRPALRAKLNSLLREFQDVRTATETIEWCAQCWWNEDTGIVTFHDWMCVDAMYRSRALEFPGTGDCMVPCVDMANHASGDATVALYETDEEGNGLLLLRDGEIIGPGDEITITYGDEKGACESIFSYGFLENDQKSARVMFLDLDIPDDDPLRPAKIFISTAAPGFRIFDVENGLDWESEYIWLVVINEEDGLDFKVRQTVDGKRDIQAFWKEHALDDTSKLHGYLKEDPSWDIYQLRAIVLLQQRIEAQLANIHDNHDLATSSTIRETPRRLAKRLRELESEMLGRAVVALQTQQAALFKSNVVQDYLGIANNDEYEEMDFT